MSEEGDLVESFLANLPRRSGKSTIVTENMEYSFMVMFAVQEFLKNKCSPEDLVENLKDLKSRRSEYRAVEVEIPDE